MDTAAVRQVQKRRKPRRKISWRKLFVRLLILAIFVLIWRIITTVLTVPLEKPWEMTGDGKILSSAKGNVNGYQLLQLSEQAVHQGNLILVNPDFAYDFESSDNELISLLENREGRYQVKDQNLLVHQDIISMLDRMLNDFTEQYPNHALNVISGYRSYELQQSLLEREIAQNGEEEASRWVAHPGNSEHHTGLAIDFGLYYSDGTSGEYDGTGDYSWISENAYRYGYILRYTKEKEAITKIAYEPWHFRYVGVAHSYVMQEKNLCLEEYLELLKQYPFSGEHLQVNCGDRQYEIYYQQGTEVYVPTDKNYEISGNNIDGFVVTMEI